MTPLRKKMVEAMELRGFSVRTHQAYLYSVSALARYYGRSPERLSVEELQAFFVHLAIQRGLSGASCRVYLHGIRFLYIRVLGWSACDVSLTVPKRPQRIPELLTRAEVSRLLSGCPNAKHRMMLTLCYGSGLRVSELVSVKVRHIDGERGLLRVEQGKGAKDRQVLLSPVLLERLRTYWQLSRPHEWLFPGPRPATAVGVRTIQKAFGAAKRLAGIEKVGGIHSLRHAYATHQLEAGLPVHKLQRLLGHNNLQSTLRYLHWVPSHREGNSDIDLVGALETSS